MFLKASKTFQLHVKRGKGEEISPKTSYCNTIVQSLASRNSNGPSLHFFQPMPSQLTGLLLACDW
jgi:hypothetical protein